MNLKNNPVPRISYPQKENPEKKKFEKKKLKKKILKKKNMQRESRKGSCIGGVHKLRERSGVGEGGVENFKKLFTL